MRGRPPCRHGARPARRRARAASIGPTVVPPTVASASPRGASECERRGQENYPENHTKHGVGLASLASPTGYNIAYDIEIVEYRNYTIDTITIHGNVWINLVNLT